MTLFIAYRKISLGRQIPRGRQNDIRHYSIESGDTISNEARDAAYRFD